MNDPNDIDFTTLNWVKQELDETLKQARQALEAYVEDQSDKSQLKYCATYMHQVQGTLRMVELYGAAMVIEEMEKVTLAIVDGQIKQTDDMLEVIMRGLVQMPDYLGRLQGGHRDIPIVLLPLLNDLRACRSEKLLTETALFSPNLSVGLPSSAVGANEATPAAAMRASASKLRLAYQFGLLKWIKGDDIEGNLGRLIAILDRLRSMSVQVDARRLWWIASGVVEGVLLKALEPSVAVKLLYAKVDREIKRIVDVGEADFDRLAPTELTKSLLYYAAHSENKGARIAEIKQLYKLETLLPTQSEIEHANSALSGRNKALLDTVGAAIKEDIMRVKDGLDMFLRGPQANVGDLATQGETLQRVADTLGVLGLGIPRKVVIEQRDIVTNIIVGKQAPEEQTLLDVAGALLFVESSLDDYIDRLGQGQTEQQANAATLKGLELPQAEVRRILDATMKEATINLSQAKQDIVAFIESPWDHGKIEGIPKLLEEISGALRMLNMPEPAELNDGVTRFIEVELLKHRRVPTAEQLDLMADALASIEYYLEAIREARPNRDRILEVTRRSLEALGYWPVPDANALGVSGSLDGSPASNEFVAFPDDFQASRIDSFVLEPIAPKPERNFAQDNHPVLSLLDIPLTEAAALAATPLDSELDLSGFVLVESDSRSSDRLPEMELPNIAEIIESEQDQVLEVFEVVKPIAISEMLHAERAVEAQELVPTAISVDLAPTNSDADSAFSDFDLSMLDHEPADGGGLDFGDFNELDTSVDNAPFAQNDAAVEPIQVQEEVDIFSLDALIGEEAADTAMDEEPAFDFSALVSEPVLAEPLPEANAAAASDTAFDVVSLDAFEFELPKAVEPVAQPVESVPKRVEHPSISSGFQMVPSDDIDDEIREVFVEEVQDELAGLAKSMPAWKADQNDFEKLKPVRRSFHTLKGSGRLVGALAMGEFSWKVENMLNRVLDKTIPVSPAVLACLDEAIAVLPQLLSGLKGEGNPTGNIGGIMYVADRISAGEEIFLPKNEPVPTAELATEVSVATQAAAGDEPLGERAQSVGESNFQEMIGKASPTVDPALVVGELPNDQNVESTDHVFIKTDSKEIPGVIELPPPVAESRVAAGEAYNDGPETALEDDGQRSPGLPDALANDPVLVDILKSESAAHVLVIRAYVTQVNSAASSLPVSEALLRAVHTLNGAIAMVDLPFVSNVLAPLEGYLKRVKNAAGLVDERGIDALSSTGDLVERMIKGIELGDVANIDSSELEAIVIGLRDNLPEPEVQLFHSMLGDDFDQSIVESEMLEEVDLAPEQPSAELEPTLLALDDVVVEGLQPDEIDSFSVSGSEHAAPDDLELYAVSDLSEYDLPTDVDSDADVEDFLDRSDRLVADLARLEEQAFAPLAIDEDAAAQIDATETNEKLLEVELLDLTFLDDAKPTDLVVMAQPERAMGSEWTEENDVFADLSFLELGSNSDVAVSETSEVVAPLVHDFQGREIHVQELIGLDDFSIHDSADATLNLEAANSDTQDAFADLGFFDELDIGDSNFAEVAKTPEMASQEIDAPTNAKPSSAEIATDTPISLLPDFTDSAESDIDSTLFSGDEPLRLSDLSDGSFADLESLFSEEAVDFSDANVDVASSQIEALADSLELAQTDLSFLDSNHVVYESEPEFVPELESESKSEPESESHPYVEAAVAQASHERAVEDQTEILADATAGSPMAQRVLPILEDLDPPGPLVLADPDEELLEIFVQEGTDILDTSDNMMARLRESPNDFEIVVGLQRELHTLKGGARMAGVNPIGDLSHSMESLFEAIVDKRANNSIVTMEALERSFDRLHQMVTRVGKRQAIGQPVNVIARLDALLDGDDDQFILAAEVLTPVENARAEASSNAGPSPSASSQDITAAAVVSKPTPVPLAITAAKVAADAAPRAERKTALDEDDGGQRQQQESIRVRADLIDNLVNYAGEVSIYRSRLEAQIGGFRFNLQEFDQTVLRLRDQLRKLEMETEAQILSRYQREETKKDIGFDPLELDRFSTLQQLSRALAESVSDLVSLQNLMDDIARQSETLLLQQSRVSTELQEGLMRTRMVPFDSLVPRLRRIMRQTGGELGKRAILKVEGAQGEMDRTVLDRMTAPLEHMLRNALAHGLELPQVRRAAGKPEEGTVTVSVSREATEVVIKVSDDGRGMDRDAIRNKAIERGLLRADAQLSDRDLFQFVLEAGFSTAETVSKISGRGVGMDVVNSEIKQLGGSLLIDSVKGVGSVFSVRLPFTLSVTQAILIKLADTPYAVPLSSVQGVMRMPRKELDRRIASSDLDVTYAGETYQIYDLGELIRQPIAYAKDESQVPFVMTKSGDQRAAVRVSQVVGSKEVVVKAVGAQLSSVPGFFGATIMGDGSVIVILDLAPLVRHGAALRQAPELASELDLDVVVTAPVEVRRQKLVMVVDDSITMRKVTTRVLERNDMEVITAKDGLDAVEQLQDRVPDLMLLDIEMPRMDGYELATYVKNDSRLKHIPIIMITSRTGEKHRQRAMEIGVERYLGKPYQEVDLLKNVMESLNGAIAR